MTLPKFKSFFWAGYECLYAKVENGKRVNQLAETKHDVYCRADYKLLKKLGIFTVREGLSWNLIDRGGKNYDFSGFREMMAIGKKEGIEQIWDLNHFDFPDDLDPYSEEFIKRFAKYAQACIREIRKYQKGTLYVVPINEISFFTLIAADNGNWAPYSKNRGGQFKKQLVRAALAAMKAIWKIDKNVRFIHVDPIFRRVPLKLTPKTKRAAEEFFKAKFEAWDMISGKLNPELGGAPKYLDIIGANYYYYNQEYILPQKNKEGSETVTIAWKDKNRVSVAEMLWEVYERYQRPIVISETGGWGALRRMWWPRLFREVEQSLKLGIPICGICAYPVIDREDWVAGHLTNSGLWDFRKNDSSLARIPHKPTINLVKKFIKSKIYQNAS